MRVLIVITDKSGEFHTMTVNAVSQYHAIKKAEKYCNKCDIWNKRIQAYPTTMRSWLNENFDFPVIKIK